MSERISVNLSRNIRYLRESRGLSQQNLATLSGVPRPTCTNLESGSSNPTLQVLIKIATALQVSLEELIGPPRASVQFYAAGERARRRRGLVVVSKMLPESVRGLDLERMELPSGVQMAGVPHTQGVREYLACETGTIELTVGGTTWTLKPGDVVAFPGDQKHAYRNPGSVPAVAYSVLVIDTHSANEKS